MRFFRTRLSAIETITSALKDDDKVQLVGFGTFETRTRAERKGRNPHTGVADTTPVFKAGKVLCDNTTNGKYASKYQL